MKKAILIIILGLSLMGGMLRSQVPMTIPNGSFEQWTSHPGYSVTFYGVPLATVYDAYSTPSVWDYPFYPVDQTINMGVSVNVNTNIPLIMASQVTGVVPDGNSAVKLQTFMLEDIVNPTVLTLAGNTIDTSIIQQAIPSILSTGAVDLDAMLPILTDIMSSPGDIFSILPTLLDVDINDFITGGLALGEFRPGLLTGSYKYHSNTSGDNGGVVLLGTHYNPTNHKREIVGGGANLDLVDVTAYTPFELEYSPLSAIFPGTSNVEPDSLIVLIISSAGNNPQQGSYLCIDNLMLWPAPDTCADVTGLSVEPGINDALLSWNAAASVGGYEYEYGPAGFTIGSGVIDTTTATTIILGALSPNTTYDVYVRTICSDTIYGEWSSAQFITLADTTIVDTIINDTTAIDTNAAIYTFVQSHTDAITIAPNPSNGRCVITIGPAQTNPMPAELKLYTHDGRVVQTITTDGSPVVLNLPTPGLFLLHATTPSGSSVHKILSR